jgi:hypothetical protein
MPERIAGDPYRTAQVDQSLAPKREDLKIINYSTRTEMKPSPHRNKRPQTPNLNAIHACPLLANTLLICS